MEGYYLGNVDQAVPTAACIISYHWLAHVLSKYTSTDCILLVYMHSSPAHCELGLLTLHCPSKIDDRCRNAKRRC